ncbi:MAG: excinuclease [Pseudomonas sp.]
MQMKNWTLAALFIAATLPAVSQARDTALFPDFQSVVQEATNAGRLDGSVKFYLAGNQPAGAVSVVKAGVTTSQKTNAFGKSDEAACSWVLQSALIRLQNAAKAAGANAVVNIASNYKNVERKDPKTYECHAGAIMAGVALKADLANVK